MSLKSSPLPDDEFSKILMTHMTSPLRKGYMVFEGCTLPAPFMNCAQKIQDLRIGKDDVFVASYPKCGTTWVQEMVWCVANDFDLERAKSMSLHERFPMIELGGLFDYTDALNSGAESSTPEYIQDSLGFLSSLKGPRFMKTHLPLHLLPKQMLDERRPAKMIYVSRDPRDCCVSFYHHCRLLEDYTGDFQDFFKLFLSGRILYGSFWDNVLGYWKIRNQPSVLLLTYEEMKKDLPSVIRRVCKFLDKPYSEKQVQVLSEHLSFESMKDNKCVNFEVVMELIRKSGQTPDGVFMRSGKSGQFLETMSKKEIELINEWCQKNIENTDYELPRHV